MKKNRKYTMNTIKKLYGASGAHCSRCKCKLIYPETSEDETMQIGEIGHIVDLNDDGSRSNPNLSSNKTNHYDNLILLCPSCLELPHSIDYGDSQTPKYY